MIKIKRHMASTLLGFVGAAALILPSAQGQERAQETAQSASYTCEATTAQYDNPTQFVDCNSKLVLDILNDTNLTPSARTEKFDTFMDEFADIQRVGRFTLGSRYQRKMNDDEMLGFLEAFRANMLTVYQVQLDQMRGDAIYVINTVEKRPGKEAIVVTELSRNGERVTEAHWRIMNFGDGWQVVDVAIDFDGQLLWLAIEQRLFHLAILDKTPNGKFKNSKQIDRARIAGLINTIKLSTEDLKAELASNNKTNEATL